MNKINLYSIADLKNFVGEMFKRKAKGKDDLGLMGVWTLEHKRGDKWLEPFGGKNMVVISGRNIILNIALGATSKSAAWYVGVFKNNYTPIAANIAADCLGVSGLYGECQDADYSPATNRPLYTPAAASGGVITNTANKAVITILQNITLYGAFLVDSQAKTSTSGTLACAKKFANPRAVETGDEIYLTYEITATSA